MVTEPVEHEKLRSIQDTATLKLSEVSSSSDSH